MAQEQDIPIVLDVRLGVTILTVGDADPIRVFHDKPQRIMGRARAAIQVDQVPNHPDADKPDAPWQPLERATIVRGTEAFDDPDNVQTWKNDLYTVTVEKAETFDGAPLVHLSMRRNDRLPVTDWRHKQKIKNQLVGEECEAVELYPAESRMVDTSNQYHLWANPDPEMRFPVGYTDGRIVFGDSLPGMEQARQRPFVDGEEETITPEQLNQMSGLLLEKRGLAPTIDSLVGIDPDWTGSLTTDEYIEHQRQDSSSE